MKYTQKIVVIILIIIAIVVVFYYFQNRLVITGEPNDEILREIKSPNGQNIATLFERDCGATTNFSRIITLRNTSNNFNADTGNIFIIEGQKHITLEWNGNNLLVITHNSGRVFLEKNKWKNISIKYIINNTI